MNLELHEPLPSLLALGEAWNLFEGRLVDTEESLYSREEIEHCLLHDLMQLWTVTDELGPAAAAVTQFQMFGETKVCYVLLLAGRDMDSWRHHLEDIEEWARENGAVKMKLHGRAGWERKLDTYTKSTVIFTKDLHHG